MVDLANTLNPNDPNVRMLELVAHRLGSDLRGRFVFIGGAVVGLLITDPANPAIRPTEDVDTVVEIATLSQYHDIAKDLRLLGFTEDLREGAPLCRWRVAGVTLDVMPTDPSILGFSNKWYPLAIASAKFVRLPNSETIRIAQAPVFIGTKLEAFIGRGGGDYLFSHDLGDIISIIDGRAGQLDECQDAPSPLRKYLGRKFSGFMANQTFRDSLPGHLPGDPSNQSRLPELEAKLELLSKLRA